LNLWSSQVIVSHALAAFSQKGMMVEKAETGPCRRSGGRVP
jgi:hypothetical protein